MQCKENERKSVALVAKKKKLLILCKHNSKNGTQVKYYVTVGKSTSTMEPKAWAKREMKLLANDKKQCEMQQTRMLIFCC